MKNNYSTSQQKFINKFPIHINKNSNCDSSKYNNYDYEELKRNILNMSSSTKAKHHQQQQQQQQQQPILLNNENINNNNNNKYSTINKQNNKQNHQSTKKDTQKYFIHYPVGSSSNFETNHTYTSSTNNETFSYFDLNLRELVKSPFQLHSAHDNNNNIHEINMNNRYNDNAELNNFESTIMLNAYKLPKKKINH
jgi:hypothetical protein